jgi:uncharacterized protein YdaU (DUF1376 family)
LEWYKRDPIRFIDGAQGLGPDAIGAYAILIDLMYARGGKTARDDRHLAGILGCSVRLARALTDRLIKAGKVTERDGYLTNFRVETDAKRTRNERETRANAQRNRRETERNGRENERAASEINGLADNFVCTKPPRVEKSRVDIRERPKGLLSSDDDATENLPEEIEDAVTAYNAVAAEVGWPLVQVFSKARRSAIKARLAECGGMAGWLDALARARGSPLLTGQNDRGWTADFDFLTRQSSFAKLMEGSYDPRPARNGRLAEGRPNRPDPALEQIARLAGIGQAPGNDRP